MSGARLGLLARFAALAGLGSGLALSPVVGREAAVDPLALLGFAAALALFRPRNAAPTAAVPWLALVAGTALLAGLATGTARLGAIDARAFAAAEGETMTVRGVVASTPRTSSGTTRFVLDVPQGRIAVESAVAVGGLDEGRLAVVSGTVRLPSDWEAASLAGDGARRVLVASSVRATPDSRSGLRGALDDIRRRAEQALERGTPEPSAALLRGFVLGQDDRISEPVRDEFRRSGLAHILAVSGQNVMLLALLAMPLLALAGVPIRARLIATMALIAVYVPVAGAGASIQRAGVMGAAGLVAALASRPRSRWYALLLAGAVTLAIDPRATADIGWQLSFAAVAGLLVLVSPLVAVLTHQRHERAFGIRRALAEGAAMTLAATLATGPLVAHHFGTVSLTAIPANLVALPAIAPAMWLGMLAGALGQVPAAPAEPLAWLGGLCAGYVGWIARALGGEWAQIEIGEPGLAPALAWTFGLIGAARLGCLALARRSHLRPRPRMRRWTFAVAGAATCCLALVTLAVRVGRAPDGPPASLTLRILDVGQGDAILLQPRDRPPLLVDTGFPGSGAAERLGQLGVTSLSAVAITHDQADHSGALSELTERFDVERVLAASAPPARCLIAGACPPVELVSTGDVLRSGRLRLEVLWPPAGPPPAAAADPNATSLVLHARFGDFDALLTGDAESELAPFAPRPVELLKVAHHGSADAGLPSLLAGASPELAVISVGADNPHGHPTPETLGVLQGAGVSVLRTDEAGEVVIEVRGGRWGVE